jgi:hypothetical protein
VAVIKAQDSSKTGMGSVVMRKVKRNKVSKQFTSVNLTCDFACGHSIVCTIDSTEDETPSITRQKEKAENGSCYWCRVVELGGKQFASEEPPRWKCADKRDGDVVQG